MPIAEEEFVVSDDEGNYGYSTKNQREKDRAKLSVQRRGDAPMKRKPNVQVIDAEEYVPQWINTKKTKLPDPAPQSFPPLPSSYMRTTNNYMSYSQPSPFGYPQQTPYYPPPPQQYPQHTPYFPPQPPMSFYPPQQQQTFYPQQHYSNQNLYEVPMVPRPKPTLADLINISDEPVPMPMPIMSNVTHNRPPPMMMNTVGVTNNRPAPAPPRPAPRAPRQANFINSNGRGGVTGNARGVDVPTEEDLAFVVHDAEEEEPNSDEDDEITPVVDTRPEVDADEGTIQAMDSETLKKEILGEGSKARWSQKTVSNMKKEMLNRLVSRGNRYDRQERYLLKLCKQEFEDIPTTVPTVEVSKSSKPKKYESLEDLMSQCKEFSEKIFGILSNKENPVDKQPSILTNKLKNYQLEGLQWLYTLHKADVNGILADEMGLGKTIQCISLFALLYEQGETKLPHLIVAPASTISNWAREIQTWCPTLNFETYYGTQAQRKVLQNQILKSKSLNVIITTYNVIKQKYDSGFFKKLQVNYVVLDEAQQIKDAQGQTYTKASSIQCSRRLLLTGSPLQNNLRELWALLSFVMPHLFTPTTSQYFKSTQPDATSPVLDKLKPILHPFILRRLKSEVALELPEKIEIIEECPMTNVQKKLYKQVLTSSKKAWQQYKAKDADSSDDDERVTKKRKNKKKSVAKDVSIHSLLNNTLMQLRKIVLSPLLLRTYYDDKKIKAMAEVLKENDIDYMEEQLPYIIQDLSNLSDFELHSMCIHNSHVTPFMLESEQLFETSGKLMKLKPVLLKLIKEKHRVLVFSQMTKVLDILELFLSQLSFEYVRLDGSTPVESRQGIIDKFNQNKEIPLFLLSTKAGGVGINLNTADTVIFFDLSFNYQVDRQAEDRCHRIGNEEKQVSVMKLITNGTVEEYIMKIVGGKKDLNDFMLDEGGFANSEEKTKTNTTSVANLHSKYISKLFNQIFKEKEENKESEEEEEEEEESEEELEEEEEEEIKPKKKKRAPRRKSKKYESEEEEEEEIDDDEDY